MTTTTDTHATSPYDQSEKRSFGERLDDWIDGFLDWFDRVVMRRGRTNTDDKPMRFSMTKAVVLNVTAVALLFAGYNGWVSLPDLSALGGMLGGLGGMFGKS